MSIKRVCVYCASSKQCSEIYFNSARILGNKLAENRMTIVYGGGKVGLMGNLADSALSKGGEVIGIIPRFMYNVEWGDGDTDWTEYGDSGVEIILKHTWEASGKYTIKAQAIDIHGAESNWAEFIVTMPKDKALTANMLLLRIIERFPMLQRLMDFWRFNT